MAYDPEARSQSKNALIIGLVALLLIGGIALALFSTRRAPEPGPTTVVSSPRKETIVVNNTVPVPVENPATSTIIVTPPVVTPPVITSTTRNSTTTTSLRTVVVQPTSASNASAGTITNSPIPLPETRASSNPNVTANVPPSGSNNTSGNGASGNGASNPTTNTRAADPVPPTNRETTPSNAASAPVEAATGNTASGY